MRYGFVYGGGGTMNRGIMEFVVYMIYACVNKLNLSPKQVYHKLQETGGLMNI